MAYCFVTCVQTIAKIKCVKGILVVHNGKLKDPQPYCSLTYGNQDFQGDPNLASIVLQT